MKNKSTVDIIGGELWRDVVQFNHMGEEFHRNTKIKDYLNKLFSANLQAVYTREKKYDLKYGFSYDAETVYAVNAKGEVISFTNSEWAGIGYEDK